MVRTSAYSKHLTNAHAPTYLSLENNFFPVYFGSRIHGHDEAPPKQIAESDCCIQTPGREVQETLSAETDICQATAIVECKDQSAGVCHTFSRSCLSTKLRVQDVLDTNTSGLMADGDSVPIKRHSAGGGSTRPAAKNNVGLL